MINNKISLCVVVLTFLLAPITSWAGTKDRLNNLEAQYPELQKRMSALENQIKNQGLVELYQSMEILKSQLQEVQGEVEELRYEMNGISKRQKDLYLDIDTRLNDLSASGSEPQSPQNPQGKAPIPAGESSAQKPLADSNNPQLELELYDKAFTLLKENRYKDSIDAFSKFTKDYPKSVYAANAQYWLGKLYYVTKKFDVAVVELNKVISNFPGSAKEADAYLNLGYAYYEKKDWTNAKSSLETVTKNFPNSAAAEPAQKRLQILKTSGK